MAADRRSAIIFLALVFLTAFSNANSISEPSLKIKPEGDTLTRSINSRFFLTCSAEGQNSNLIRDLKWLDPNRKTIESKNSSRKEPSRYTEKKKNGDTEIISLFFTSLQEYEAGTYYCTAKYAGGNEIEKTIKIEGIVAITWDDAPENQYPIMGENYLVKCKVRARPPPQIDWFYNDNQIVDSDSHRIIETNGLRINNVSESDDGIYICRATVQETGEVAQKNIRVEVHQVPIMNDEDVQINIVDGETASIKCNATSKPPPKYSWVRKLQDQDLSNTNRFSVNEITGVLTFNNVNNADTGVYFCKAKNAAGEAQMSVMVNVIVKPKISEFTNITQAITNNVNITCEAQGNPAPEITFRKHTSNKPYTLGVQSNDDRIVLTNNKSESLQKSVGILTINNVMRSDDGLYECLAKNSAGSASRNGHLTVEFPPSFDFMQNVTEVWTWDRRPVNLTCIAESIPNATIRWWANNQEIKDGNPSSFRIYSLGPAVSVIEIAPGDPRFYTNYKCIAVNTLGQREHIIQLKQAFPPSVITRAKIEKITATMAKFDLQLPIVQTGVPIKSITVQYRKTNQNWERNKTWPVIPDGDNWFVLEDLKPSTWYEFRFAAQNVVGLSPWSSPITETTLAKAPPTEPKITIKTDAGYETSRFNNKYELRWSVLSDNGEPIDYYEIKFCRANRANDQWEILENTCRTEQSKSSVYWINNLYSDSFYWVEVKAHNILGYSEPGHAYLKTAREPTDSPVDSVISVGETAKLAVTAIATTLILSLAI